MRPSACASARHGMTTPQLHSSFILANIYVCLSSVFLSSGFLLQDNLSCQVRESSHQQLRNLQIFFEKMQQMDVYTEFAPIP
jgi:hypothetical protein